VSGIPQLRDLGEVLSHTAQTLQPELLTDQKWGDVNKRDSDSNACAKILSRLKFETGKTMGSDEFHRFVQQVFLHAAS